MSTKLFLNNYLTFFLLLCVGLANAQDNCKEIKATIEVFQAGQKAGAASVVIDFHGQASSQFAVTLIGPKGYYKKDIIETEVKGLNKGSYTLVFSPKNESDNFCMKRLALTIK